MLLPTKRIYCELIKEMRMSVYRYPDPILLKNVLNPHPS